MINARILRNKKITFVATAVMALFLLLVHAAPVFAVKYQVYLRYQAIIPGSNDRSSLDYEPGGKGIGDILVFTDTFATKEEADNKVASFKKDANFKVIGGVKNDEVPDSVGSVSGEIEKDALAGTGMGIVDATRPPVSRAAHGRRH